MNQYTDTDVEIMKTTEQNDIDTKRLFQLEDGIAETAERISTEVFRHPELGDSEFYCSAFLADEAEKAGFEVTRGYLGLPTAFRADFGNAGGPTVAFLAEYDALPGYGPDGKENGHACGHNWIAASTSLQTSGSTAWCGTEAMRPMWYRITGAWKSTSVPESWITWRK